jgi:hypothetical protein
MNHITGGDIAGGGISSGYVVLKLTIFTEATYHFGLVAFDAAVGGIVGLLVVHYGKKLLKRIDEWIEERKIK